VRPHASFVDERDTRRPSQGVPDHPPPASAQPVT
jgi:hypothetical protein